MTKLKKDPIKLDMVDQVFKEQREMGVIQKIENLEQFKKLNKDHSFLAHMPVYRMSHPSTPCRLVFLSNVCEKSRNGTSMSHNQTIEVGPSLNSKISTAILFYRFDRKVLLFDLKKAFLQIQLYPEDSMKLAFLWYENVKSDPELCGFVMRRLTFGLRCSPAILMLALYKILILDVTNDGTEMIALKKSVYSLFYMDNSGVTADSSEYLFWAFNQLSSIFNPYGFKVQQVVSNDEDIQNHIDEVMSEKTEPEQNLLGLRWNTSEDSLSTKKLFLDPQASTKRTVLQTVAKHYDIYNIYGPVMNRARVFLHLLQSQVDLGWDTKLNPDQLKTWKNITRQANSTPEITIPRYVGSKTGSYSLVACTDASQAILGVVVYIIENETGRMSFLLSKYSMIDRSLKLKSIPNLELQAITLGVECLIELTNEMSGSDCVNPVKLTERQLLTDSLCCIGWLNSYNNTFDKMNKKSVFVQNRLEKIGAWCNQYPITFRYCAGALNPADCITRCLSHKQLSRSNYFSGPNLEKVDDSYDIFVPNPILSQVHCLTAVDDRQISTEAAPDITEASVKPDDFSSYDRLKASQKCVQKAVNVFKQKLKNVDRERYKDLHISSDGEIVRSTTKNLILADQKRYFSDVIDHFNSKSKKLKDIPVIVTQLNVFRDSDSILRVKSKLNRWSDRNEKSPILMSKNSALTKLIIKDVHQKLCHSGIHSVISHLRREFWVPNVFITVKKVLKTCTHCRRVNCRAMQLNQSPYREFRLNPSNIPFRQVFVDHLGPYEVRINNVKQKVWLLLFSCLWSRAVNLKICRDMTADTFIRAFQMHIYEYGTPELCLSDLGSSIVRGGELITQTLNEPAVREYLNTCNVQLLQFEQYPKGCHKLGGIVEAHVKIVKRIIYGAIRNSIMDYFDFELIVSQTIHLCNRRPISFKSGLRDCSTEHHIPDAITPEILLKGHELVSLNIIPELQNDHDNDPEWHPGDVSIDKNHAALLKARSFVNSLYHSEFLSNLEDQATNVKKRYVPVQHRPLQVGDVVLLKEINHKPNKYPMGIVRQVKINDLGESTEALIFKGSTHELVRRHVNSIVPLLTTEEQEADTSRDIVDPQTENQDQKVIKRASARKAALSAREKVRSDYEEGLT